MQWWTYDIWVKNQQMKLQSVPYDYTFFILLPARIFSVAEEAFILRKSAIKKKKKI